MRIAVSKKYGEIIEVVGFYAFDGKHYNYVRHDDMELNEFLTRRKLSANPLLNSTTIFERRTN